VKNDWPVSGDTTTLCGSRNGQRTGLGTDKGMGFDDCVSDCGDAVESCTVAAAVGERKIQVESKGMDDRMIS
jgi:hypothetical protein